MKPYLHIWLYPPHYRTVQQLAPIVTLQIIDQLERFFPQNLSLLSIVK